MKDVDEQEEPPNPGGIEGQGNNQASERGNALSPILGPLPWDWIQCHVAVDPHEGQEPLHQGQVLSDGHAPEEAEHSSKDHHEHNIPAASHTSDQRSKDHFLPHMDSKGETCISKPEFRSNRMVETPNVDFQPPNVALSKGNGKCSDVFMSVLRWYSLCQVAVLAEYSSRCSRDGPLEK
jgi:hypothetical protein